MSRPVVHLYTVCWDEADMLGFFFRHYDPWIDRYVVYDDGSTDGSLEILRAHPRVVLRRFARTQAESFVLSHKAMQDEAWKESRGRADWICITAIDEHLHAGGRPMAAVLAEAQAAGVTLLPALGFDMNHPEMPDDSGLLVERVTRGRPRSAFNKLSLFRPDFVRETGFGPGRHAAEPAGDLVLPARDAVMLWHYKHLGFARNAAREAAQALRLGAVDVANEYGQHYRWSRERLRGFWDEMEREAADLSGPGFEPGRAAVRPLWWEARPDIRRQAPRPAPPAGRPAEPRRDPMVSVLIKAHNHAAYVGRTIESVLEQSFQDFEIVVTDDGSTDGTRAAVARYADPRIRLDGWSENRGIPAAMNATVARARGRYLAILNSDDWALPGRLERQATFLEANPQVSLVFGMPRPVGEAGEPVRAFNDFGEPLRGPDFSRRTWLRRFFFAGNCLCAPTAMIRREAYAAAGPYDPRLTNLQDLDMWVRMLVCGHAIHVLPDAVTAFRIRADNANTSAPRPDTRLRSAFETIQILYRFAAFDEALFAEVFGGADPDAFDPADPVPLRVAALAARVPTIQHRHAAVALAHAHARTPGDHRRLRAMAGSLDALNIGALEAREARIRDLDAALAERDHALAASAQDLAASAQDLARARAHQARLDDDRTAAQRTLARLEAEHARLEAEHARLGAAFERLGTEFERLGTEQARAREAVEARLAAALASRERMRNSVSWRATAVLRWVGRRARAIASRQG